MTADRSNDRAWNSTLRNGNGFSNRGKPLERGKPLQPGEKRFERGAGPKRVTRLIAVRKPRSEAENTARRIVLARSNGLCEARVPGVCEHMATEYQHRKRRPHCTAAELWATSNGLAVCGHGNLTGCHGWIHQFPDLAHPLGLHIESWELPAATPVRIRGRFVLLDDHGGHTPYVTKGTAA